MSNATLKQAGKIISVFEDISTEKMQAILASGLLADLRDGDISRIDREKFRRELALNPESLEFLKLISGDEILTIDECDGSRIIADAKDIFAYIDSDFKNWGADEKGSATKETPVQVYEMERDGTFSQLVDSLSSNPRKVCLTQDQILGFIRKYRGWLRTDGYGTFFPFKSKGNVFVAGVDFDSGGGLGVSVSRLEIDFVWFAERRPRVVVPRLA